MLSRKSKGFTLIELLVVIAIIGILSTLAIIALGSARQKARDSKRVADLNQIGKALELYFSDNNAYPTLITTGQPIAFGSTTYLAQVPSNPAPRNDGSCDNLDYAYESSAYGSGYLLSTCVAGATGSVPSGAIFASSVSGSGVVACGSSIIDRDGYTYRTVKIGDQCWMAQGLRSKTRPDGSCINTAFSPPCPDASVADNDEGRSCYDNDEANCASDGALYTWIGATFDYVAEGDQGICPSGWHVPTDAEWHELENGQKETGQTCNPDRERDIDCVDAGTELSVGGSSGFEGVWAGARMGGTSFQDRSDTGYFISSSQYDDSNYNSRHIGHTIGNGVMRHDAPNEYAYTLRCVKS